jgi:cysteine desulfurase/selenocysteine lyase
MSTRDPRLSATPAPAPEVAPLAGISQVPEGSELMFRVPLFGADAVGPLVTPAESVLGGGAYDPARVGVPAATASTPGLSGAGFRSPTAPTLPDADIAQLGRLIGELANQLYQAPPAPSGDDTPVGSTHATPPNFGAALDGAHPAFGTGEPLASAAERPAVSVVPQGARPGGAPAEARASTEAATSHLDPAQARALDVRSGSRDPFDPYHLRRQFPILREQVHGKRLVWLDNAATTQKPDVVIDRLKHFYERENSNVHRAAHTLAARATDAYERARQSVQRFIGAASTRDIIFVRGATEGINLVAQSWGRQHLRAGDEIVVTHLEHHANIVPWQMLCQQTGAKLRVAPVDDDGQVRLEDYERLVAGGRVRLVAFTQVSNALGTITPAKAMIDIAHRYGALVLLDGAQAVSHMPVNVSALGCDFYVFSGHKVFAPTGIGVVCARAELMDTTPPWQGGGNMIADVTFERTVYQPAPQRFEAGTGNIADAVGLGAALDWLSEVGIERVEHYEHALLEYGTERLRTVPGLTLIGTAREKAGVLSFVLAGHKTEDIGGLLDREGIAVRSGHHCAQPILRRFGVEATVRASLAPYNTREDLDVLVDALCRLQAGGRVPLATPHGSGNPFATAPDFSKALRLA